MKLIAVIALLLELLVAAAINHEERLAFQQWKDEFNITYSSVEAENVGLQTFCDNRKGIEEHNKRYQVCEESYALGIWRRSDLTIQEVNKELNGLAVGLESRISKRAKIVIEKTNLTYLNWAESGYVTPVQYQGSCGSC